jgi:WD40 repeat protein
VYEIETGKLIHSWNTGQADPDVILPQGMEELRYSPTGDRLLTVDDDHNNVRIWDTKTFELILEIVGLPADLDPASGRVLRGMVWFPDGKRIADPGKQVRVWSASDGNLIGSFGRQDHMIEGVYFSPNGKLIATIGGDAMARLWDADTLNQIARLSGQPDALTCGAFSPDGRLFASGGIGRIDRKCVVVWDTKTHEVKHRLKSKWIVEGIRFSPAGRLEVLNRFRVEAWDPESGKLIAGRISHLFPINKSRPYDWFAWATHSLKDKYVITTVESNGSDGDLRVWEKIPK